MNYARKYLCSRIWKAVKVQIVQLGIPLNYLVLASSKRIILMHIDLLCHWILPFLKLCCLIEVLNDDERWRLRNIWMQCVSSDLSIIKLATANNWGPSLLDLSFLLNRLPQPSQEQSYDESWQTFSCTQDWDWGWYMNIGVALISFLGRNICCSGI